MSEDLWSETLLYFLKLTAHRLPGREWMVRRFAKLLETHRHLMQSTQFIKIAGTNGKGSVAAMLESCLIADNKNVGLFTSPHLYSVTERFRINAQEVDLARLEANAAALRPDIDQFVAENGSEFAPSFFEILLLVAIRLFHEHDVDICIVEAGVGGESDATSLLPAVVSVITTVSHDHTEALGETLREIAIDKAGIAPDDTPLILGPDIDDELCDVIASACSMRNVTVETVSTYSLKVVQRDLESTVVHLTVRKRGLEVRLNLIGIHQVGNFLIVAKVIDKLEQMKVSGGLEILRAVEKTNWAGRMEYIDGTPAWLLDAAHNPRALKALSQSLDEYFDYPDRALVYGASAEKDYKASLSALRSAAPDLYLVSGFYKAVPIDALRKIYAGSRKCFDSVEECADKLNELHRGTHKTIIATGSVFMVGKLRRYLLNRLEAMQ